MGKGGYREGKILHFTIFVPWVIFMDIFDLKQLKNKPKSLGRERAGNGTEK
jgi:hypothetical protein